MADPYDVTEISAIQAEATLFRLPTDELVAYLASDSAHREEGLKFSTPYKNGTTKIEGSGWGNWNLTEDASLSDNGGTILNITGDWYLVAEGCDVLEVFGITGDGVADDTMKLQSACDYGKPLRAVNSDLTILTGNILTTVNIDIDFNGCAFKGSGSKIFTIPTTGLTKFNIKNVGDLTYSTADGSRDFIDTPTENTSLMYVQLYNCSCRYGRVDITVTKDCRVTGFLNKWVYDDDVKVNSYLVKISADATMSPVTPEPYGFVRFNNNDFRCKTPDGLNKDLLKITGNITGSQVKGNKFLQENPLSVGNVDVFTGGDKCVVKDNDFLDTNLTVKQYGADAGGIIVDMSFSKIIDNHFQASETNSIFSEFIYCIGSLHRFSGNTFKGLNPAVNYRGIYSDNSASGIDYDDFGTDNPILNKYTENTFDWSKAGASSVGLRFEAATSSDPKGYHNVSDNTQVDGSFLLSGNDFNPIIDGGGNVCYGSARYGFSGVDGSLGDKILITVDSNSVSDVDASKGTDFDITGAGNITSISNGYIGQEINLISTTGTGVLVDDGATIRLNYDANYKFLASTVITLKKVNDTLWIELSRKARNYTIASWNPSGGSTIADRQWVETTATLNGAELGDIINISNKTHPVSYKQFVLNAVVTASNTVTISIQNQTGADFGSPGTSTWNLELVKVG